MPVVDLNEYRTSKVEAHLRERPSQVLPMTDELLDAVSLDTETTGLHVDDGATVAAVSVAYRTKSEPDHIYHHAFAFDQGRAADKGFVEVLYSDTPTNRRTKLVGQADDDPARYDVRGLPKGDPLGVWDWHTDYNLPGDEWRALMRWLTSAGQAVTLSNANIKFDLHHLRNGTRHFDGVELEKFARWDTQLTSAELWPGESTALKATGVRLWGEAVAAEAMAVKTCLIEVKKRYGLTSVHGPRYDLMPWEINGPYASQDTVLALRLRELQIQMLDDGLGSWRHVDQAHDLMRVLYRMEARRFGPIDVELALREADRIQKRMDELVASFPFQPPTPAAATEYFFVDLGLRPWKSELGEQSREVEIVADRRKAMPPGATRVKIVHYGSLTEKIADRMADAGVAHAGDYAEFLRLQNANQMFYRNYANLAGPGDRLMTNFKQAFVKSGRMSVERWQAQAIPKKLKLKIYDEPVAEPRSLFLLDPDLTRVNLDLKQAELRIAAMMSGCQAMLDQLLAGVDFHTNTTKRVFGIDESDPDWSLTRDIGKRLTFSSIFLIGPKSFREQLWLKGGIEYSFSQACDAVYGWRNTYPEFKVAYDYWGRHFERHNHVLLIDGQPSWLGPRDWPHTGWSRVVQSSLALFVRDWLIRIEKMTARYNALTLTVHDSVNLDLPCGIADQVTADIIEMSEELWLQWFGIPGGVERGEFAKG